MCHQALSKFGCVKEKEAIRTGVQPNHFTTSRSPTSVWHKHWCTGILRLDSGSTRTARVAFKCIHYKTCAPWCALLFLHLILTFDAVPRHRIECMLCGDRFECQNVFVCAASRTVHEARVLSTAPLVLHGVLQVCDSHPSFCTRTLPTGILCVFVRTHREFMCCEACGERIKSLPLYMISRLASRSRSCIRLTPNDIDHSMEGRGWGEERS